MARFATFTVGSQVIVIPKNLKYEFPAESRRTTTSTGWWMRSCRSCGLLPSPNCARMRYFFAAQRLSTSPARCPPRRA